VTAGGVNRTEQSKLCFNLQVHCGAKNFWLPPLLSHEVKLLPPEFDSANGNLPNDAVSRLPLRIAMDLRLQLPPPSFCFIKNPSSSGAAFEDLIRNR
jgi:hypothetical protein